MKYCLFFFFLIWTCIIHAAHFLTFIMPCYNCEKWVEEAVGSIYQQKLNCPFELICTDDGSSDTTYGILSSLAQKYPEMKVLRHEKNRGGGAARNTCISHSQGDIIFCLDSDNVLVPNSVQKLIDRMDETGCDIVCFGGLKYFRDNFREVGQITYYTISGRYRLIDILERCDSPPWSGNYLYTKKSYGSAGGYPESWGALDTYAFGFLQLANHCEIAWVPATYYWHRHHEESYWVSDARAGRLTVNFLKFMLQQRHFFLEKTAFLLQDQLDQFNKSGKINYDITNLISGRMFQLRQL